MAETMANLEAKLDPEKFIRIHRGRIVNTSRITAVESSTPPASPPSILCEQHLRRRAPKWNAAHIWSATQGGGQQLIRR